MRAFNGTRTDPPIPSCPESLDPDSDGGPLLPSTLPPQASPEEPPCGAGGATLDTLDPQAAGSPPSLSIIGATLHPSDLARPEGSATTARMPPIPGYELLEELGRGGMGVVYKARDQKLSRLVALKMVLPDRVDSETLARFRGEAEAVARLMHPNIVQIYEVNEWRAEGGPPIPYCALEFIEGGSLDRVIENTPQSARDSAVLIRQLADAIHAAHQKNIVHRDLKPSNVLLVREETPQPDPSRSGLSRSPLRGLIPKIADFGLAKRLDVDSAQTQAGSILGTPYYMAPEQAEGRIQAIGPWTDVYALGAILYELLTGRVPFKGRTAWDTLSLVRLQEPVPPRQLQPGLPRDLETICLKCLRKSPGARYLTARELADDLGRYLDHKPILARPTGRIERLVKWARRSPFRAAALVATLGCFIALTAFLYDRKELAEREVKLVEKEADLSREQAQRERQQAELARRALAEQQRIEGARTRFVALFTKADNRAGSARRGDKAAWGNVERDLAAALELVREEPTLTNDPLLQTATRLHARAQGELKATEERERVRSQLTELRRKHGDAVFFITLFSGLEMTDSFDKVRAAVREGLASFGLTTEGDGPPRIDPRFFEKDEPRTILELCYELVLLDAEVLARSSRPGELQAKQQQRLRQALALLDRADRLGLKTRIALERRADFLEQLNEKVKAGEIRVAARELSPSTSADFFLLGLDRYFDHMRSRDEKDLKEAGHLLGNALREQPEHFGALYLLAACQVQERKFHDARRNLSTCLALRPDFLWPHLLRGFASMELGRPEELAQAEADFDTILRNPPDTTAQYVALVNRGVLGVRRGLWQRAVDDFEEAIRIRPDAFAAYVNLAKAHTHRLDRTAWQEHLLQLGAASPGLTEVLLMERRRGAYLEGVGALDRGIERRKDVAVLFQERGRLHLLLGNRKEAARDIAAAIRLAPAASVALANDLIELGRLLHAGKEYQTALVAFEAVLQLKPDLALAHRLKAQTLLALDRYQEAGAALDLYLEHVPRPAGNRQAEEKRQQSESHKARGLIHAHNRDQRAAIASYTQALQLERDPELLLLRGWGYLMTAAPRLALADFEELLELRPDSGEALLGRADARVKLGDWKQALDDVEAGIHQATWTSRNLYNAARVHAQAVTRLMELNPTSRRRNATTEASLERAVELLGLALQRVPEAERATFWREYIERDPALGVLTRVPAMIRLAERIRP